MEIQVTQSAKCTIIKILENRLDARMAISFKANFISLIEQGHRRFIVDLENVSFMDSSGIASIVSVLKLLGRDGEIVLCGLGGEVLKIFKLTRMDRVFKIHDKVSEALDSFA